MNLFGIGSAVIVPVLALVACVPTDTSETYKDESMLIVPVPSPGLRIRAERKVWQIVPGTHSVIDRQASVLLKRHGGVGDVFISSPPMVVFGSSVDAYHAYIVSLGNMTVSKIVVQDNAQRHMQSFRFEEWRDNVLCTTEVTFITFGGAFMETVLFRGSWRKGDDAAAIAVRQVSESIYPNSEKPLI